MLQSALCCPILRTPAQQQKDACLCGNARKEGAIKCSCGKGSMMLCSRVLRLCVHSLQAVHGSSREQDLRAEFCCLLFSGLCLCHSGELNLL